METINLKSVNPENEVACSSLEVKEDQAGLIAPNAKSIEWAKANPKSVPLAVYTDTTLVGFVLYEPRGNDVFSIHRVMIDRRHQKRGIARRSMELTIAEIKKRGGVTIYLSFRPENHAAKHLFQSLGFVQHEIESDGEIVFRLGPPRAIAF